MPGVSGVNYKVFFFVLQVLTSAPDSTSEEIAEMNRKLERSEKDPELMNR
jgi:hypothetical protein